MPNLPVGMSGCDRNGIAGNCGTEHCDTLMDGDCEMMDDFDPQLLHDLGVIEIVPQVKVVKPKKVREQEAADDYDRAMEILL